MQAALKEKVEALKAVHGRVPCLAVVLVGQDPASEVYVAGKHRAAKRVGIDTVDHRFPATVSEDELVELQRRGVV